MRFVLPSKVTHEPTQRTGQLIDIVPYLTDKEHKVVELYGKIDFDGTVEELPLYLLIPLEPVESVVENDELKDLINQLPSIESLYPPKKQVPTIEAKRDDEHGLERPWIGLINNQPLRNKKGRIRTFGTEEAALAAALKEARITSG